ncbi:MAG TPA: DUF4242 domain-containing protein [Candidatus Limnocylindrales bacterium]|jgi:hypothetical protein
MPLYVVERSLAGRLRIAPSQPGEFACQGIVEVNAAVGVTWVQSYVREDCRAMFCIYDAANPEAIRRAAERNGLPVDRISRVTVLEPYPYRSEPAHQQQEEPR